jgi:hypothetical protein
MRRAALCLLVALASPGVLAHKASDSLLSLTVSGGRIAGRWDIALRDLEYAIGVDGNGDGAITWGELRTRYTAIAAYALSRLDLRADSSRCNARPIQLLVDEHSDGTYAVLRFSAECPSPPRTLTVVYRLLFDLDPQHRGLLRLEAKGRTQTAVLGPDSAVQHFDLLAGGPLGQLLQYGREGVWHIWLGYDHILFLVSLLLPAVLRRDAGRWQALENFPPALGEVLAVVTAFTLAHSLTLSLAVLGVIALPSRWVESAIAASILAAALNNLYPLFKGKRWLVAFGFGLVHGLGFASALMDLGLPTGAMALALVGFNLGIEAGQMAIVAVFLPTAYWLRRSWVYQRLTFGPGSALIAALALVWLVERSTGLALPFP